MFQGDHYISFLSAVYVKLIPPIPPCDFDQAINSCSNSLKVENSKVFVQMVSAPCFCARGFHGSFEKDLLPSILYIRRLLGRIFSTFSRDEGFNMKGFNSITWKNVTCFSTKTSWKITQNGLLSPPFGLKSENQGMLRINDKCTTFKTNPFIDSDCAL